MTGPCATGHRGPGARHGHGSNDRPGAGEGRKHLDELPKLMHRAPTEPLEPDMVPAFAVLLKTLETGQIPRRKPRDFLSHLVGALVRGVPTAVRPSDLVERIKRQQIHVIVEALTAGLPKLAKDLGHGDDRRAKIKPVPALPDAWSPARPGFQGGRGQSPGIPSRRASLQTPVHQDRRRQRWHAAKPQCQLSRPTGGQRVSTFSNRTPVYFCLQ